MTKPEIIKQLKIELSVWESDCKSHHKTKDALKAAIERLEQDTVSRETYENEYLARKQTELELWKIQQNTSDDCVSRKAMLDAITEIDDNINMDIYTNEVRDIIRELQPVTPTTCIAKVTFSKDDLQELVDEKVEELAQHMKSRWIPVSERLPEEEGDYLLWGKVCEDEEEYQFIGSYDSGCEQFGIWQEQFDRTTLGCLGSEFFEYASVIAWMPLPEPYKAEMESEE